MAKKDLSLEESIFIGLDDSHESVARPLQGGVFKAFGFFIILIGVMILGRILYFHFFLGELYNNRASVNAGQHVILKASRGIIYDRYGEALLRNNPSFEVNINLSQIFKDRSNFEKILEDINKIVPFDIVKAQSEILSSDLEKQAYYPVVRDITLEQVIELKKIDSPSIVIESNYKRDYIEGTIFSHILGYTSLVNKDDLQNDDALRLNDEIGKAGLEYQYDSYLRGKDGLALKYKDAKGEDIDNKTVSNPVSGNQLYTTIDAGLQKVFYKSLVDQLSSLGRISGAGLAMNPQTGEILSLVSVPSFDNNNLTSSLFVDNKKPLFNRVISGVYSPGSTIKPLVAFAALEEAIVDPLKSFFSKGYIELPNPYNPDQPSRFVDWKPHGWVNMYSALARSSNVYFYYIGGGFEDQKGLGIEKLREYWKKFKLDQKTGVDYPSESFGVLPDVEVKEKRTGQIWRIGDTYNVSIGQGDLMVTPLELLRYICAFANEGKLPKPYFVKEIKDSENKSIFSAKEEYDLLEMKNPKNIEEVKLGMIDAVKKDYGTANLLNSLKMSCAGKTGSAQIQNNQKTNAFVVAFCSVENPEIAVLVLIEDAKEGSLNAVPVAKKVLEWYYMNRVEK